MKVPEVAGGRPVVVAVRLSVEEAEVIDAERGRFTRSAWLRLLLLDHEKRQTPRSVDRRSIT